MKTKQSVVSGWSSSPFRSVWVEETATEVIAVEDRAWRYRLCVMTVATLSWLLLRWPDHPGGFIWVILAVVFILWAGPWHRRVVLSRSDQSGYVGLQVLYFFPIGYRSFSLSGVRLRPGDLEREETKKEEVEQERDNLGCLLFFLGPLGTLISIVNAMSRASAGQVTVTRRYPALCLDDPSEGERVIGRDASVERTQ